MAYLNLAETYDLNDTQTTSAQSAKAPGLSALEWSVVALARRDRPSSLKKPGRIASAIGTLFGTGPNPQLADPRLEALRRISVLGWRNGYAIPASEVEAFQQAGFSIDQYEILQRSIGLGRSQPQRRFAA